MHHGLGVDGVGVALVAVGVHILFYSQSVTGCKGYFLTRFNSSRCSVGAAGQITARCSLETAVVDCFGNIARCNQFACIILCRRSHFSVGYSQRSGIGCHFIGGAASCVIHGRGNGNTVTSSYLGGGCFELVYINRICTSCTLGNIGNLITAVVQSACCQADRIAANCCWSDGHAAAVSNGFVTRRIGGGHAGKVRSLFHANRNSRFACRSILGNFGFQIAGRRRFCGIACNNGQLFT